MSRKSEFHLSFSKATIDGVVFHFCDATQVGQPETFAVVLEGYDKTYTKYLIDEIENAPRWREHLARAHHNKQ